VSSDPAFTPDIRTLAFLLLGVGLLATAVFAGLWWQRRDDRALGYWGAAHGLGAGGYLLIGLRGWIPDSLSIIAANVAVFIAAGFLLKGLRLQLDRPFPERAFWLFIASLTAAYAHFTLIQPALAPRVVIAAAAAVILLGGCTLTLLRVPRPARTGVHVFTATAFAVVAALQLVRAVGAVTDPHLEGLMAAPAVHGLSLTVLLLGAVAWTFGLLWLAALGWRNELVREVAARRRSEARLRENEQRFRAIFDYSATGIAFGDDQGNIILANDAFAELVGHPMADVLKKNFMDLTHPDDRAVEGGLVAHLLESDDDHYRLEKRYITGDGRTVWVDLTVSAIRDEDGRPLHFVGVANDIEERKARQDALEQQASYDALTGAMNRHRFNDLLAREQERVSRYHSPAALIMLDIDHFKAVNDSHGHAAGDLVLQRVAELARERLRDTDLLARWGGEEFLILLPETDLDGAAILAEGLRRTVAGHAFGDPGDVTVSQGVVALAPGETVTALMERVDAALYTAKAAGRNRVESDAPSDAEV
jgi:diguanylate cyclase (GGDEF)-like protein/PAS domain S-box-containing protein